MYQQNTSNSSTNRYLGLTVSVICDNSYRHQELAVTKVSRIELKATCCLSVRTFWRYRRLTLRQCSC